MAALSMSDLSFSRRRGRGMCRLLYDECAPWVVYDHCAASCSIVNAAMETCHCCVEAERDRHPAGGDRCWGTGTADAVDHGDIQIRTHSKTGNKPFGGTEGSAAAAERSSGRQSTGWRRLSIASRLGKTVPGSNRDCGRFVQKTKTPLGCFLPVDVTDVSNSGARAALSCRHLRTVVDAGRNRSRTAAGSQCLPVCLPDTDGHHCLCCRRAERNLNATQSSFPQTDRCSCRDRGDGFGVCVGVATAQSRAGWRAES